MVEISEIRDQDSLMKWLDGQPQDVFVAVALRMALRVFPIFLLQAIESDQSGSEQLALAGIRALLMSSVAHESANARLRTKAANLARQHSYGGRSSVEAAIFASAFVSGNVNAMRTSIGAALAAFREFGKSNKYVDAGLADEIAIDNMRNDCLAVSQGNEVWQLSLWVDENPIGRDIARLFERLRHAVGDWSFWMEWYEQMLDPIAHPPNWPLLEQIALIDAEVWDAGPKAVSEAINAIQLGFSERALTTGEQFYYDPDSALFLRRPVQSDDGAVLKYCVERLSELSDLAETMGNMQGVLGAELFFVRRAVETHADNPVMVWDNCGNALKMLKGNLASGALPPNEPYVTILQATLADVRGRLEQDPAVRYVAPHRPDTAPVEDQGAVAAMVDAAEEIAAVLEPEIADEVLQDSKTLRDRFASHAQRVAAYVTSAGRVLGVFLAACAGGVLKTLDGVIAVTERINVISKNCAGIAGNVVKISAGLGGPAAAILHSDKIPSAIEWILRVL